MSGAGVKQFVSGEIFTASHINGYLMDQVVAVFDSESARNSSFGSSPLPELSEGRFCYIKDINEVQYFDGSSWVSANQFSLNDGDVDELKIVDEAVSGQKIANATIVNEEISASAQIPLSKLANSTSGNIVICGSTGSLASTSTSGDVLISSSGFSNIQAGSIFDSDVSTSAEIDQQKLADMSILNKTSSHPLVISDANSLVEFTSSSNLTLTIPLNSTVAFPVGSQVMVVRNGPGEVQIVGATDGVNTVSIVSASGFFLRARYSVATLIKRDTNEWYLIGDTRS